MSITIKLDDNNTLNISITAKVNSRNFDHITAINKLLASQYGDFKKLPLLKRKSSNGLTEEVMVSFSREDSMPDDLVAVKESIGQFI